MIDKIPNEIIDPDKMADILVDVHLAESMIQESKDDSIKLNKDKVLSGYYGVIMKIHQVSQEEFVNSYNYYDEHPLILHYIHNTMTERLSLMESRYK